MQHFRLIVTEMVNRMEKSTDTFVVLIRKACPALYENILTPIRLHAPSLPDLSLLLPRTLSKGRGGGRP